MGKLFDYVVFDDMIEGTAPMYSRPEFNSELTRPDSMALLFQGSQVSVTSGTGAVALNAWLEISADATIWTDAFIPAWTAGLGTAAVNLGTLVTGAAPVSPFARLRVGLTVGGGPGAVVKARVRIVASARTQS